MLPVIFLLASVLILCIRRNSSPGQPRLHLILALALPFAAGGFHTGTAAVLSLVMGISLCQRIHREKSITVFLNRNSIGIALLFVFYCLTPFWAADRGMAVFAFPRYLPLVLFMLLLMQPTMQNLQDLLPACGSVMTALSCLALLIPGCREYVCVNGRLAGFFQYPNSYAAFLLAGLIVQNTKNGNKKTAILHNTLLISGIVLSGSKTVFVLMGAAVILLCLISRKKETLVLLAGALLFGIAFGLLMHSTELLAQANRFTDIHTASGTFLVRLLYFRDVLPAIAAHPFGLGYMSYPAIEGTIQTGRYYVTFIHNGLLQLLLEIGWIPALLMAWCFLRALFSGKTPVTSRMLLLFLLSHCMLDFDLQFPVFWVILLTCLDFQSGKKISITAPRTGCAVILCLTAAALWLGCGDWLHRTGNSDACLMVTPFHTEAKAQLLADCQDPQQLDTIADEILTLNSTHSLAYSAKANAALAAGDTGSMIRHKEAAIRCAPYTTEEYCDYFEKLYAAMQIYLRSGDRDSADYCWQKLLQIPEMMDAVSKNTHPLAELTGDDSSLVLPPAYAALLQQRPF